MMTDMKWCIPITLPWWPLKGYRAITIWPFVFYRDQCRVPPLVRNEQCHVYQWLELLWIGFVLVYGGFYVKDRLRGMNHRTAYLNNPLERESRAAQTDAGYLRRRKLWAWRNYV